MCTCRVVHYIARHGTLHTLYPDEIQLDHIREADVCTHPPDKIVDPPEVDTLVPKHVGIDTIDCIL
jgi:hypothetical protein